MFAAILSVVAVATVRKTKPPFSLLHFFSQQQTPVVDDFLGFGPILCFITWKNIVSCFNFTFTNDWDHRDDGLRNKLAKIGKI